MLIFCLQINVFLWPYLAVLWESRLYDARNPSTRSWWPRIFKRKRNGMADVVLPIGPDTAISIRNLGKDFKPSSFFKGDKDIVTAVSDLSLEIPKFGIYVLLGSNGYVRRTNSLLT